MYMYIYIYIYMYTYIIENEGYLLDEIVAGAEGEVDVRDPAREREVRCQNGIIHSVIRNQSVVIIPLPKRGKESVIRNIIAE